TRHLPPPGPGHHPIRPPASAQPGGLASAHRRAQVAAADLLVRATSAPGPSVRSIDGHFARGRTLDRSRRTEPTDDRHRLTPIDVPSAARTDARLAVQR